MSKFEAIRDRLPSLYRPEDRDTASLLARFLLASAKPLDTIDRESSEVMQSRWWDYADRALYSPFFLRGYQLLNKPLPKSGDLDFPYVFDLARLAALLPLAPWRGELVEAYRERIRRFVRVFKEGLGTVGAIRRMTEAQLPIDVSQPVGLRDRPFTVEEFSGLGAAVTAAATRGEPSGRLGPLMRWTVYNHGPAAAPATLYIQGSDKAERPLIELYAAGSARPRIGIGYKDELGANQTLRLLPAFTSWLLGKGGIDVSVVSLKDPTAPGPWSPLAGIPDGEPAAVTRDADGALLAAFNADGGGGIFRFDGKAWTAVQAGIGHVGALSSTFFGTTGGLFQLGGAAVDGFGGRSVFAILRAANGSVWAGTDQGLRQVGAENAAIAGTPVHALFEDQSGTIFAGGDFGLFERQANGDVYWFSGEGATELQPDWVRLSALPAAEKVFLPPVTAVLRGPDAWLWIGTANGICRYGARSPGGLAFETVLEAFPELGTKRVNAIAQDERGQLWFATDGGLFRFDGRDWSQLQNGVWKRLGAFVSDGNSTTKKPKADNKGDRGVWRFDRPSGNWQQYDDKERLFKNAKVEGVASDEAAVKGVVWVDRVHAEIGQWDGTAFTNPQPVDDAKLVTRFKPDEQTVRDGGIAAIPRIPQGESVWRYLSMEPDGFVDPGVAPFWTTEGRLIPPPADLEAAGEGRFNVTVPAPESDFDQAVFAYPPEARVWMEWNDRGPFSVLVRLKKLTAEEQLDPSIIDRVWEGIERVRPAGVRVLLAVEEEVVKGN